MKRLLTQIRQDRSLREGPLYVVESYCKMLLQKSTSWITSGAIQNGEPITVLRFWVVSLNCPATPCTNTRVRWLPKGTDRIIRNTEIVYTFCKACCPHVPSKCCCTDYAYMRRLLLLRIVRFCRIDHPLAIGWQPFVSSTVQQSGLLHKNPLNQAPPHIGNTTMSTLGTSVGENPLSVVTVGRLCLWIWVADFAWASLWLAVSHCIMCTFGKILRPVEIDDATIKYIAFLFLPLSTWVRDFT